MNYLLEGEIILSDKDHPHFLHSHEEIKQYFVDLAIKEICVEIQEDSLRVHQMEMGCLMNGECTFSLNQEGQRENHPARFSFLFDLSREDPILLQHSSTLP